MKFVVTFKTPDVAEEAAAEAVDGCSFPGPDESDDAMEECMSVIKKFTSYGGEYIEIEFDSKAGTATVVPRT